MMVNKEKAFQTIQACMHNLCEGSGHPASYSLDQDSFSIISESYKYGLCTIEFHADGISDSEFVKQTLKGSITLRSDYSPAFTDSGLMLNPWKCILGPEHFLPKSREKRPSKNSNQEKSDFLLSETE